MPAVQIDLPLYEQARLRAEAAGFASVDEYVTDLLRDEEAVAASDLARVFTPERLAELERIDSEMVSGGPTYTPEEVAAHLKTVRDKWLARNSKTAL